MAIVRYMRMRKTLRVRICDLVKREVGYLTGYKNYLKSLNDEFQKLKDTRKYDGSIVDAVIMNGGEMEAETEMWVEKLDGLIRRVEGVNDEAKAEKKCFGILCCLDLWHRYKRSKQALEVEETIRREQGGRRFLNVSLRIRPPHQLELMWGEDMSGFWKFESTQRAMDEVIKALREDSSVDIVGVYGMRAVGKTTLVKQVAAQVYKDGLFHRVIMVVVSQNPDKLKIQDQLADGLGMKLDEETESGRAERLKERMTQEGKILVVLDDLWTEINLSELGIPHAYQLRDFSSKILLTSRHLDVCTLMNCHATVKLNAVSQQDSCNFFISKVKKSHDWIAVAIGAAQECGGHPIALISVAEALHDKDIQDWEEALHQLQVSTSAGIDNDDRTLNRCIELSYNYLRHEDAKQIFRLCCQFQEDFDIEIEVLVRYGIGKGLFSDSGTIAEARDKAESVVKHLVARRLLLESHQKGCVKMDRVVRDWGIKILASPKHNSASLVKAGVGLQEWPSWNDVYEYQRQPYEGSTSISLMHNQFQQLPAVCYTPYPNLQVLLLQSIGNVKQIPDKFFQYTGSLRVLDLSKNSYILCLPSSFGLLTSLRILCLDSCELLADISILGELKMLEILTLSRNIGIEKLPQEIAQLVNLRMLDLSFNCGIKSIPPKLISSMSRLEELYMNRSFDKWGQEGNACFEEVTCLQHLKILEVGILHHEFLPENVVSEPNYSKFYMRLGLLTDPIVIDSKGSLRLGTTVTVLPRWFNNVVTAKAEQLWYENCRALHDIVEEHDHQKGSLNGLKSLRIRGCHETACLMNFTNRASKEAVFPSLEVLCVENMGGLQQMCVGKPIPHGSLANLKVLKVYNCAMPLAVLLPSNLFKCLQNLRRLVVFYSGIKEVFECGGELEEEQPQEVLPQAPVLQYELREVCLAHLPQLSRIWNNIPADQHISIFQNLNWLCVMNCSKLENLFTQHISRCLLQLDTLVVSGCHALKEIITRDGVDGATTQIPPSLQEIIFPKLSRLALEGLHNLISIYSGNATVKFPSLKYLHVNKCPKFRFSTDNFHSNKTILFNHDHEFKLQQDRLWSLGTHK